MGVSYSQLDRAKESPTSAARTSPDLYTLIALLAGATARTIVPQQLRVTRCTPSTGCRSGLTCSTQRSRSVRHLQSASTTCTQLPTANQPVEQTRAKLQDERWRLRAPLCLRSAAPCRLTHHSCRLGQWCSVALLTAPAHEPHYPWRAAPYPGLAESTARSYCRAYSSPLLPAAAPTAHSPAAALSATPQRTPAPRRQLASVLQA